ncbi:outer membrane protein [Aureimonas jatrophae]|jgi:outer membrane immunogenic protein|uniref:Outer membrane immunogenic protein n=1 Tax=Aureimonas jatrophae TaxID=1166073 RepID=A0A1H0K1Z7_9HYPH|nr:outer membrane beta-barrel protein [Aureimonas jatrophae]MBB3950913.1 outer membrane immunogenic protein [Aureimonas jatrophae]SDO50035.1 outer membrane immunogenic protein [Aureimonas jatrophae]
MQRLLLALGLSAAFVTPVLAADVVYEEPAAPIAIEAAPTWTGLYLGIQGGGAFQPDEGDGLVIAPSFGANTAVPGLTAAANNGFAANTIGAAFGNSFSSEFDSSFIGGAHIGYDYQAGNFVIGVLADINAVDIKRRDSAFSNTPAFYTAERSLDYLATGRLRAGYLLTPTALAYATGGIAYGEVDYGFSTDSPAVAGNGRSTATARPGALFDAGNEIGYSVGGGVEVKITQNISFGAEYLYTDLGDRNLVARLDGGPFDGNASNGAGSTGGFTDFGTTDTFDFHTVTAKLSYRFN